MSTPGTPRHWQHEADRLAHESIRRGDPTGWFEELYARGASGEATMAWDRTGPHPLLADWSRERTMRGEQRRAIVVGCGLGSDAEHIASLGFATTAFDLSPTAIRIARERRPDSPVDYRVADLFELPEEWAGRFDLVVDVFTVQALPPQAREKTIASIARLVSPGGVLVTVQAVLEPGDDLTGPPWPLTRDDISRYVRYGLEEVRVEVRPGPDGDSRWLAELGRPGRQP